MRSVRISYHGPSALASALVALLSSEGLAVSWDPNQEQHTGDYADDVVIQMLVTSASRIVISERATKSALEKFAHQFPGIEVSTEPVLD